MHSLGAFLERWNTWQSERFPVLKHGLIIIVFACAALGYSSAASGSDSWPGWGNIAAACVASFGFFLLLRVADEFKDYEDDCRYRPYRAVPRGVVTLRSLFWLGVAVVVAQIGSALWLDPSLLWLYGAALGWFALMSAEFFVPEWLKRHAAVYLTSHMLIVPLIALYATAHHWLVDGIVRPPLAAFLALSFFNGTVLELGRKIRTPADEEAGVDTYSALWGSRAASDIWIAVLAVSMACAVYASVGVAALLPMIAVSVVFALLASANAFRFHNKMSAASAKRFELLSGLWLIASYVTLGIYPVLVR